MKKILALSYFVIALFVMIPGNCKAISVSEKVKQLREYFALLTSAHSEYKTALKEYDTAIQKQCSKEIENLAKASKNLFDANPWDFKLMQLLGKAKTHAQAELDECIAEKCKDAKAKLDAAAQNLKARSVYLRRALLVAIGGAIVVGAAAYFGPKIYQKAQAELSRRRYQEGVRQYERSVDEKASGLIRKYGVEDTPEARMLLKGYIEEYPVPVPVTDPRRPASVRRGLTLSDNLVKALAEVYFGEAAEGFTDQEYQMFRNFLRPD